jgi:hypothetical protein
MKKQGSFTYPWMEDRPRRERGLRDANLIVLPPLAEVIFGHFFLLYKIL